MKKIIIFIIALIIPVCGSATEQIPDILIWKGDTSYIFAAPLERHSDINSLRSKLFGEKEADTHTGCGRGYMAEWSIIEDEIFLTNIFSCQYYQDSIKSDLKTLFGDKCKDGRVKADWITGDFTVPKGKILQRILFGSHFYEFEVVLTFKEGALIAYKEYDNTKTRISKFIQNQDSLNKFIYSNVDWSKVPDLKDKTIRVLITIHSGATSKADTIFVARASDNEFLTQEALRVAKLIPEWDVYYRLGEVHKQIYTLPINFNEKNRAKYCPNRTQ